MGTKKDPDEVILPTAVSVRFTEWDRQLYRALSIMAEERGESKSELLKTALRDYIKRATTINRRMKTNREKRKAPA